VPVRGVCHFVHVELLKLFNQAFIAERGSHLMKSFPVTLGVLHAEVLVVEMCAPSLEPKVFRLVEIHGSGLAVQMLYACTVIEARQVGEGEATSCGCATTFGQLQPFSQHIGYAHTDIER